MAENLTWSATKHNEIIKRLMNDIGQPNSQSLYGAFKQFANELHALNADAPSGPEPATVKHAVARIEDLIDEIKGEVGPDFDPKKWSLDIKISDLQAILDYLAAPPVRSAAMIGEPAARAAAIEECAAYIDEVASFYPADGGSKSLLVTMAKEVRSLVAVPSKTATSPEPITAEEMAIGVAIRFDGKAIKAADFYTTPEPDAVRDSTIDECVNDLIASYPDHAWLNPVCAALRSLKKRPALSRPAHGGWEDIIEQCAKVADAAVAEGKMRYEQTGRDKALSDRGRQRIEDQQSAAIREAAAIANGIRALARKERGGPDV